MDEIVYSTQFFDKIARGAIRSARATVPFVVEWIQPASVVDIGCGTGAWLSVFREAGIRRIIGMDGDYVNRSQLLIPGECFIPVDLCNLPPIEERFDLAVCLEVAEHLPAEHADRLIRFLTRLAPVVLFSAAIPHQGGNQHVNEQWPDYWAEMFRMYGFMPIDCLRPRLWTIDSVEWWYAQNMLLFLEPSGLPRFPQLAREAERHHGLPLAIVHPKAYANWVEWVRGMYQVTRELAPIVRPQSRLILVDDGQLAVPDRWTARPFLERNGVYAGPPSDDAVAISELERMIDEGATYIAIAWPAFWWLDYYCEFARYLLKNFGCVHQSEHLRVFDLQRRNALT